MGKVEINRVGFDGLKIEFSKGEQKLYADVTKFYNDEFVNNLSSEDSTFVKKFFHYLKQVDQNSNKIVEKDEFMQAIHLYVKSFYPNMKIVYNGPFSEEKSVQIYTDEILRIFDKYNLKQYISKLPF
ncbi:MAG: hypothetical protein RMJ36_03205 [Candidatus Calescibacterium sp.]|nr:hypothetical protein [Candidatus Calescibacterium sp.]MDW8132644.1 hypothetical protein [Candidatus Calescibacterium sp.]